MPKITRATLENKLIEIARRALQIRFWLPETDQYDNAREWVEFLNDSINHLKEFEFAAFKHGVEEYEE